MNLTPERIRELVPEFIWPAIGNRVPDYLVALAQSRLDLETARKERDIATRSYDDLHVKLIGRIDEVMALNKELAAKDREIEGLKVVADSLVEVGYLEREEGYGIYDSSIDDHAAFEFEDHTKLYAFKKPRSTIDQMEMEYLTWLRGTGDVTITMESALGILIKELQQPDTKGDMEAIWRRDCGGVK